MGIVHCQVCLPEECASKFVFNKKNMSTIFSCTRALSYALLWLLQSGVYVVPSKSNWKKKTCRSGFQTKKERDERPFFGCKSKMVLSVDRILSVNHSNKRYSPLRFYLQRGFILQHKIEVYTAKTRTELFRKSVWKTTSFRKNNLQPWTSLDF